MDILGTIVHKDRSSFTVKDEEGTLWRVDGLQPIYDGAIGLSKALGRKCFIGRLTGCAGGKAEHEGKETYVVVRTPLQRLKDTEYMGLEATLFVMR